MPDYTLRWANRSQSTQDWQVSIGDNFQLLPDYVRTVNLTINNNHTFQIAVSVVRAYAAASLTYTAATQTWTLNSHTPNEWQLVAGNNIVTVRGFLENVAPSEEEGLEYRASDPEFEIDDPE